MCMVNNNNYVNILLKEDVQEVLKNPVVNRVDLGLESNRYTNTKMHIER